MRQYDQMRSQSRKGCNANSGLKKHKFSMQHHTEGYKSQKFLNKHNYKSKTKNTFGRVNKTSRNYAIGHNTKRRKLYIISMLVLS